MRKRIELRENHAVQRAEGADVSLLTPDELAARFPWMSTDGVALAPAVQATLAGLSSEATALRETLADTPHSEGRSDSHH